MTDAWKLTQVELRTIWERRRVEYRFEPLEATPVPEASPPALDPWAEALDVPDDGREAIVEKERPDLAASARCACYADGRVLIPDCRICHGSRAVVATPVAVAETGTARWLRCVEPPPRERRGLPTPIVLHLSSAAATGKQIIQREAPKIADVQGLASMSYRSTGPLLSDAVKTQLERVLEDPGIDPLSRVKKQILEVREIPVVRDGARWTVGDPPVPWEGELDYGPPVAGGIVAWSVIALALLAGLVGFFYCAPFR